MRLQTSCFLTIVICSCLCVYGQIPAGPGDWPQWRGPHRDGISPDKRLLKRWPEDGPSVAWSVDTVGVGYSSIAVKDGRIFTQGDLDGIEHIIALNAEDGALLWAVQPEPIAIALNARVAEEIQKMDKDGDGVVDEFEALSRLGWNFNKFDRADHSNVDPAMLAKARGERLFAALDENKDDVLSFDEAGNLFREYFTRIDSSQRDADANLMAKARTEEIIRSYDKDANGMLSRVETRRSPLDRAFNRADKKDPASRKGDERLTREEIQGYFAKFEAGKDGLISVDELSDYLRRNHAGRDGILSAKELRGFYGGYRNGQGDGPRGTPTVDGDRVYAEGGNGDLTCLDATTGRTIWHTNLQSDLSGGRPGWGYSESPLVVDDWVIVTPGGRDGTLAALDKMTGDVIWRSFDLSEGAHYSSPVVATIGGIRQVIQFARSSVFGVRLDNGKLLWQYSGANNGTANAFTPIVDDGQVFVSSAYGTGSGLAKVTTSGDSQSAEQVYFVERLASHHGGAVKIGDYLYSNGGGSLTCLNFSTGEIIWQDRSVGKGSLVAAGGMLYLLSERYNVALVEATPEGYREHGRFKIADHGRPSWAHPVVIGGRLYIRNQQSLAAYDIRDRQ